MVDEKTGRTALKSGGAQQILAVVREETYDTLENRVLKDFLNKALVECERFLKKNSDYDQRRFGKVKKFSHSLKRIQQASFLDSVKSLGSLPSQTCFSRIPFTPEYGEAMKSFAVVKSYRMTFLHGAEEHLAMLLGLLPLACELNSTDGYESSRPSNKICERKPSKWVDFRISDALSPTEEKRCSEGCFFILPSTVTEEKYRGLALNDILGRYGCDFAILIESPDAEPLDILFVWASMQIPFAGSQLTPEISKEAERLSISLIELAQKHDCIQKVVGIWCYNSLETQCNFRQVEEIYFMPISNKRSQWREKEMRLIRKIVLSSINSYA